MGTESSNLSPSANCPSLKLNPSWDRPPSMDRRRRGLSNLLKSFQVRPNALGFVHVDPDDRHLTNSRVSQSRSESCSAPGGCSDKPPLWLLYPAPQLLLQLPRPRRQGRSQG